MDKKITIRDVAKAAGVSIATVSNVLNGINKTSPDTRERITRVMKEMEFQPNFTARALSSGKTNQIALITPYIAENISILRGNLFYMEFLTGLESVITTKGFNLIFAGIRDREDFVEFIKKRKPDGLVFLGIYPAEIFEELKTKNIPVILIDNYEKYADSFVNIVIDDFTGGYIATKHLIEMGHREIAIAAGDIVHSPVNRNRFEGYKRALSENNIEFKEEYLFQQNISFEGGIEAGENLEKLEKVTAVFAVADIVAFGIIRYLTKIGRKIPEDISIVGFDDLEACKYITPELTTIKQDAFGKGTLAAELILESIENNRVIATKKILPIELIKRESTDRKMK